MKTPDVNLSDDPIEFVTEQRRDLMAALDRGHADYLAGKVRPLTDDALRDIARRGRQLAERRAARKR
jgi:hypothetical protein